VLAHVCQLLRVELSFLQEQMVLDPDFTDVAKCRPDPDEEAMLFFSLKGPR
jgi:hypothetical protein